VKEPETNSANFERLLRTHQPFALAVALRILRNRTGALEVVQDSFIRVWKNFERYDPQKPFTTWLYTIVVRCCYDRIKMERRRTALHRLMGGDTDDPEPQADGNPATEFESKEAAERIVSLARRLPPKQRMVFLLRDVEDCSMEKVAELVGISVNSVKVNLFYARRAIRIAYEALEG
jgi:RNA polymerase sigma-70 factor (ECF subfamily)